MSTLAKHFPPLTPRGRLGLLLGPALLLACGLGLAALGLKPEAAWAAGVVALMAAWWITEPLPLWATALLPLPLFPLLAGVRFAETLVQYFEPVNFLFLGGMWLAAAMQQWGLHERLALGLVARVGCSPRRIVLGFMGATAFATLWISNTAAALMMFPIAMAVLARFEAQRGRQDAALRQFGLALMLGLAYAASIGGIGTKIGTGTNMVFVRQAERALGLEVSFVQWLLLGLPVVLIALPLVWLYLVRVATRLPAEEFPGARDTLEAARLRLGAMQSGERVVLAMFLLAAGLWIFRQDLELGAFTLPGWSRAMPEVWRSGELARRFPPPLAGLLEPRAGESLVAMGIGLALLVIPAGGAPRRMALGLRQAAGIQWGMLLLLGGGFAMATGVEKSGLSAALGGALEGTPQLPPLLVTLGVALVAVALTEVASNTATASILLPLLAASAPALGVPAPTLMLAATIAASFGFMLPAGTPPNAVVYSSGYVPVTRMARCGLAVDLAGALLVGGLCHVLVPLVLRQGAP